MGGCTCCTPVPIVSVVAVANAHPHAQGAGITYLWSTSLHFDFVSFCLRTYMFFTVLGRQHQGR